MRRGDIFYCTDPVTHGDVIWPEGRPCVIVSAPEIAESEGNRVVQVVFLTTQPKRNYPSRVRITSSGREATALCDQIVAIPKESLGTKVGTCTEEDMRAIERGMLAGLGIAEQPEGPSVDDDTELVTRLTAERDTYKAMHEQLLSRLLEARP